MRMIDKDALKEQILDWISEQVVSKYISHDACMATREGARVAFNLLNDAPTTDAVPVVRGKWIRMDETQALLSVEWKCSQCGQEIRVDGILTAIGAGWKYCPNCGADMRRESEGGA